jgi:hypothetical protein
MDQEKEILDDDFNKPDEIGEGQLTSNINIRAVVYFIVMIFTGSAYCWHTLPKQAEEKFFFSAFVFILQCVFLSLILEIFRFYIRKRKFKKTGIKINYDPFWFQVIEGGFAIWILFSVYKLIVQFLK